MVLQRRVQGFQNEQPEPGKQPESVACVVSDGYEPWFKDDFSTGRVKLYVLNQIDVVEVERIIADA
jgi:hypothetical protein